MKKSKSNNRRYRRRWRRHRQSGWLHPLYQRCHHRRCGRSESNESQEELRLCPPYEGPDVIQGPSGRPGLSDGKKMWWLSDPGNEIFGTLPFEEEKLAAIWNGSVMCRQNFWIRSWSRLSGWTESGISRSATGIRRSSRSAQIKTDSDRRFYAGRTHNII